MADHFRGFAAVVERDGGTTYPAICRARRRRRRRALAPRRRAAPPAPSPAASGGGALPAALGHRAPIGGVLRHGGHRARHPDRTRPPGSDVAVGVRRLLPPCTAPRSSGSSPPGRPRPTRSGAAPALLPGLCHVAAQYGWQEPLSLLDLGTSAGLNLLFDDYAYTYRSPPRALPSTPPGRVARPSPSNARPETT